MGALPRPVIGCDQCKPLHVNARNHRGDLADVKKKLILAQQYDDEDRFLEQIPRLKEEVKASDLAYLAHHAEKHPEAGHGRDAFATAGGDYVHESADLPPAAVLVGMLDAGMTRQQIADRYGCSVSTVGARISMSGLRAKKLEPTPAAAAVFLFEDLDISWQDQALCAQTDPELFFPDKSGSTREAKRVCQSCEVRTQCLEYAIANQERFGVWGGLSERERRKVLQERTGNARTCAWCAHPLPGDAERATRYCGQGCVTAARRASNNAAYYARKRGAA